MCLFVSALALQDRLHDGKTGQVSGGGMTGVAGESKHGVKDALGLLDQKLRATGKSEFELSAQQTWWSGESGAKMTPTHAPNKCFA